VRAARALRLIVGEMLAERRAGDGDRGGAFGSRRRMHLFAPPRARYTPRPISNAFQRVTVSKPEASDTQFFNSFSVVLGLLIAFAIVLFAVARVIGRDVQGRDIIEDPLHVKAVQENIAPFAHEAVAGQDNSALAIKAEPSSDATGSATAVPTTGEAAFQQVCSACHGAGINGAPKAGDHAAWAPRIAQGKDTLYSHAINGYKGMPARGSTTWPDATIKMAVDYMVAQAK
jgi:cytochrome c5